MKNMIKNMKRKMRIKKLRYMITKNKYEKRDKRKVPKLVYG